MEYNEILSDLKNKKYKPIYFLSGEEPYYIDVILDYIEKNVLDEAEKEFNQTVLYGGEITPNDIVASAKRFPMMSEYQVVIIKEAQSIKGFLKGGDDDKKADKTKSAFEAYVENPLQSTILVICYREKKLDKRTNIGKLIAKNGVLLESKKLYDNQVPDWIKNYLIQKKYTLNPKAAVLLAEYLGTSLSKITNEIDKLIINLPPGTEITPEHVQQNIGISKDYNAFELQTAITKRDVVKANKIINYFASNPKENPMIMVLALLHGHFVKILLYHGVQNKTKANVASELGINPFFVGDYELAAKNYPLGKLKSVFANLREYDLKVKGVDNVSATEGELLKELVFKIIH